MKRPKHWQNTAGSTECISMTCHKERLTLRYVIQTRNEFIKALIDMSLL